MRYQYTTMQVRPKDLDRTLVDMGGGGWRLAFCFDVADRDSLPEYLLIFERGEDR